MKSTNTTSVLNSLGEDSEFRPMRRFKQQLPDEECKAILERGYRGFLAVNGEGGFPYTIPMNFLYHENHIYFHSAVSGHKIDVIKTNPKACFTIIDEPVKEENDWWYHVRSVVCFGSVSIVNCEEMRMLRLRQFGEKYFPVGYDINAELLHNAPHTVLLDFSIEHMTGKQVKEN